MDNKQTIKDEIIDFKVLKEIVEVGFEDYILDVDLKDLKGLTINKDTLAEIIFNKYETENKDIAIEKLKELQKKYGKLASVDKNKSEHYSNLVNSIDTIIKDIKEGLK